MVPHRKYTVLFLWPLPWGQGYTKCCPVPSSSFQLCTCEVWSCYVKRLKRRWNSRKNIIWPWRQAHIRCCSILFTSYDLCTYKILIAMSNSLGEDAFTRKDIIWPLTLNSRSYEVLPSTLNIKWPIHMQSLKVLCRRVKEEMYLQEYAVYYFWPWPRVKVTRIIVQYPLHYVTYAPVKFEANTSND